MNSRSQKKMKVAIFGTLQVMIISSLLAALSIVFGKYLAIRGGNILRFSFENLPVLMAGILYGPIVGAVVGLVADLVGCVLVSYDINPLVTLGMVSVGLVSGLLWRFCGRLPERFRLLLSVSTAHVIGSVLIKTFGLAKWYLAEYNMALWQLMLWRLLNYLLIGALEFAILYFLLKNRAFRKVLDKKTRINRGNHSS